MVYERNLLDFIPNKAKLNIIKLIIMRMKILLGLMLCFLGIQIYRKIVEQKKIIKKISKRSSTRNDKSIKQISQLSEALQFFST